VLTALADAHAPIAASLALHGSGVLAASDALQTSMLAIGVNTLSRCVVAAVAGGPRFAWRTGRVLVLSAASGWLALRWLG
jgi:uncharacterized membrane protein (DUF4010 family)